MSEIFSSPKTTMQMDSLYTQEDIDNRYYIMGKCDACGEWSKWDSRIGKWKCSYCGGDQYDMRGGRSIRTWLTTKDMKKTRRSKKDNRA